MISIAKDRYCCCIWIRWVAGDAVVGYAIRDGTAPRKLYNNIMVLMQNEYWFKAMGSKAICCFTIETFNNG